MAQYALLIAVDRAPPGTISISREPRSQRNGGAGRYRAARSGQAGWDRARRPKRCKWLAVHS